MTQPNDDLSPQAEADLRAALRVTEPMPADVWARLRDAIDAEAAQRTTAPASRRRAPGWPLALAAAAAVVAVGVIAWPGRQQAPVPVAAEQAAAPATDMNAAPGVMSKAADAPAGRAVAAGPAVAVTETGTDYAAATIDDSVIRLVADVQPDDTPTSGSEGFTATLDGLADCLGAVLVRAETPDPRPLVVDRARHEGVEVGVLVLEPAGQRYEVFVLDLGCSSQNAGIRLHTWVTAP